MSLEINMNQEKEEMDGDEALGKLEKKYEEPYDQGKRNKEKWCESRDIMKVRKRIVVTRRKKELPREGQNEEESRMD